MTIDSENPSIASAKFPQDAADIARLCWDYRGPQAQGTAEHFLRHLDEFLPREGFEGCETGVEAYSPVHHAAWCFTPEAHEQTLIRALRPRRAVSDEEWAAFMAEQGEQS